MIASMSMPEQRDEEDMEDIKKMPRIAQDKIHAKGIDIGIFITVFLLIGKEIVSCTGLEIFIQNRNIKKVGRTTMCGIFHLV